MNEKSTNVEIKDTQLESVAEGDTRSEPPVIPKANLLCPICKMTTIVTNLKQGYTFVCRKCGHSRSIIYG